MQQKTRRFLIFVLPLTLLFAAGCALNPNDPPDRLPARRFAGSELRIACPDPLTRAVLAQAAHGWADRCGVKLDLVSYDPETEVPDARADVWVLDAAQVPRWAAQGQLRAIPEEMTGRDGALQWSGLLEHYGKRLLTWERVNYAVPLLGDAPVCFYRKDLFAEAKYANAFRSKHGRNIVEPATWEEFVVLAEFFQQANGTPSLGGLPMGGRAFDSLFYNVAASFVRRGLEQERSVIGETPAQRQAREKQERLDLFSFHFNADTGAPLIDRVGFVQAVQFLQRLQACRPQERERSPGAAFRAGRAALCVGDVRLIGPFQEPDSPVRDRFGICRVPGHRGWYDLQTGQLLVGQRSPENRVPYLGGSAFVLTVPRSSERTEAAFALLEELGSKNGSQQLVLESSWGGGAMRTAQLDDDWPTLRLPTAEALRLGKTLRQTLQPPIANPVLVLRVPREQEFRAALMQRVRGALEANRATTEETATAVLRSVANDWTRLIGPNAADHVRAYRLSLGLQ